MNAVNATKNPAGGIRIEGLRKVYGHGDTAVEALKNVNMAVAPGEVVGLVGPSGSGKEHLAQMPGRDHRAHGRAHVPGRRADL